MITRHKDEAGLTTAEYAVGTLGACTVGGLLAVIAKTPWAQELIQDILGMIPKIVASFF